MPPAHKVEGESPVHLHELKHAGRSPALPLSLSLSDSTGTSTLRLQRLLRVIPGQRYVGVGEWCGRPVLAKLLVGSKASRHFERERMGAQLLAERQQSTPQLLAHGLREGEGGWLLFEYLDGSQGLGDAWQAVANEPPLSEGQQSVLAEALAALAGMHAQGLWQADLHLDNVLRHQGRLYLIDGGAVHAEGTRQPLSRARALENLGLFFAQLPGCFDPFLEELVVHYLLVNGEHALPLELLQQEVARQRRGRLSAYLKKLGRDCTEFSAQRGLMGLQVVRREEAAGLHGLLADPDGAIEAGKSLKRGRSSTVALVDVGGRSLVIKRYNIKGFGHWLKRFWRPSRAWHSWVEGNRLGFLGIATPKPLAIIERRWCGLRGRSYLVTECIAGDNLLTRLPPDSQRPAPDEELQALQRLMADLARERISHGDLKGTNLLWDRNQWALIDLDALCQHAREGRFRAAFRKDRARLLRNWPAESILHGQVASLIPRLEANN